MKKSQKPIKPTPRPAPLRPSSDVTPKDDCSCAWLIPVGLFAIFVGFMVYIAVQRYHEPDDGECYLSRGGSNVVQVGTAYHGLKEVIFTEHSIRYGYGESTKKHLSMEEFAFQYPKKVDCIYVELAVINARINERNSR